MSRKKDKKNRKSRSAKQIPIEPIITEIFLRLPQDYNPAELAPTLDKLLATGHIPAMLINAPGNDSTALAAAAKLLVPIAQSHNCAVLIENDCTIARDTNADGVHITDGTDAHQSALALMKPDFITGGQSTGNRHDAMLMAERGADYIYFHDDGQQPAQNISEDGTGEDDLGEDDLGEDNLAETEIEQARWWAKTFEVPTVFDGKLEDARAMQAEFLCIRDQIWSAEDPLAALEKIHAALSAKSGDS